MRPGDVLRFVVAILVALQLIAAAALLVAAGMVAAWVR